MELNDALSPEPVADEVHDEVDAANEPLTKARLFTSTSDDGSWTEMGIGVVSVLVEPLGSGSVGGVDDMGQKEKPEDETGASTYGSSTPRGGGKRGVAEAPRGPSRRFGKLVMVALEDPDDVLVSTPLSLEDIYLVQRDTILVWSDPQLGRDMACSFNTKEGCDAVLHDIYEYQRTERLGMVSSLQDERVRQSNDRWAVRQENLPLILEAVTTNTQRFGIFVREHDNYFSELVELFLAAETAKDTATLDLVSQITLALLKSPYNTEGKIIGQFVESRVIEKCIDIVQYGIGRRDAETGFVSFEQRRATFRNPCKLPPSFLPRIHVLYACGYLKDLLPLSLEDGDASSSSLLSMFLTQFKLRLMEDICESPTILPHAFRDAAENRTVAFQLAAFVNDITKTVKNAMIVLSSKEHIYELLTQAGAVGFLHRTIQLALDAYATNERPAPAAGHEVTPGRAVQLVCDALSHLLAMQPSIREALVSGSANDSAACMLTQLMRAMTLVKGSAELQSVADVLVSCVIDTIPGLTSSFGIGLESVAQKKRDILNFWINGNSIDRPPLFLLASSVASLLPKGASASSQPTNADRTAEVEAAHSTSEPQVVTAAPPAPARPAGDEAVLPLSASAELRVVYGLKVLARLVEEAAVMNLSSGLPGLIELSGLLAGLRTVLVQRRQRRWANVQSTVVSFIASLVENEDVRLLQLLRGEERVLEACMELFLAQCHRDNILSSSTAHVFVALCERVHQEKCTATGATRGPPMAAGPYASFVRGDDSVSVAPHTGTPPHDGQDTVASLVEQYGPQLHDGAPALAARLEHALAETPEEAQQADAESSSVASTIERSAYNGMSEFDTLAIEFGVDPGHLGQSPPMEASEMEEQLSVLSRELSEEPLHLDEEDDDEEADEEEQTNHNGGEAPQQQPPPCDTSDDGPQDNLRLETLSPIPAEADLAQSAVADHDGLERDLKRRREEEESGLSTDGDAAPRSKPRTELDSDDAANAPSASAS